MPCVVEQANGRLAEPHSLFSLYDPGAIPMGVHPHKSNGFSLIELMIVVVVFGMLIAIAIPTMSGYLRSNRRVGAAHTLEADFHYAHTLAHEQGRTYQILFQPGSYTISQVSPFVTIRTRRMPLGVACAASDTAKFYAWGLTDPVTVTLTNAGHADTLRLAANGSVSHD
jgi:prepilin-type N-terminal cleavage/methylation domain-containing protein